MPRYCYKALQTLALFGAIVCGGQARSVLRVDRSFDRFAGLGGSPGAIAL